MDEFFKGQKEIKLLDPNILAAKEHEELLLQLIESKAWVDFTQGIDARLLTEKNIELLRQIKLKRIHFAWDDIKDEKAIVPKLTWFREVTGITHRKATVYILTNYNSTFEEDLYRVYKIRDIGMTPYVMIYEKEKLEKGHVLKKLQRYVNCQFIFRKIQTFEEYTA